MDFNSDRSFFFLESLKKIKIYLAKVSGDPSKRASITWGTTKLGGEPVMTPVPVKYFLKKH